MIRTLPGTELTLSPHCLQRMLERNVSIAEVQEAIGYPDDAYLDRRYLEPMVVYRRGDVGVVVDKLRNEVKTVLYRYPDVSRRWSSSDGRPSGRVLTRLERAAIQLVLYTGAAVRR